jgi:hypothetical protein
MRNVMLSLVLFLATLAGQSHAQVVVETGARTGRVEFPHLARPIDRAPGTVPFAGQFAQIVACAPEGAKQEIINDWLGLSQIEEVSAVAAARRWVAKYAHDDRLLCDPSQVQVTVRTEVLNEPLPYMTRGVVFTRATVAQMGTHPDPWTRSTTVGSAGALQRNALSARFIEAIRNNRLTISQRQGQEAIRLLSAGNFRTCEVPKVIMLNHGFTRPASRPWIIPANYDVDAVCITLSDGVEVVFMPGCDNWGHPLQRLVVEYTTPAPPMQQPPVAQEPPPCNCPPPVVTRRRNPLPYVIGAAVLGGVIYAATRGGGDGNKTVGRPPERP